MTVDTKELVTTIAYLIGVKKHIIEQCFDAECHDTLQKLYAHKGARTELGSIKGLGEKRLDEIMMVIERHLGVQ